MAKKDILDLVTPWMIKDGPDGDVVLSSRIRLARNLKDQPFPWHASLETREKVRTKIKKAINPEEFDFLSLEDISSLERENMMESHLLSPQIIADPAGRGVAISKDRLSSIMVNEEDHLRIQSIAPGLDLDVAMKKANAIDDQIEKVLDLAFDEKYGYLTAWPTNVGTGIRVSAMVHLPGLALTNNMPRTLNSVNQLGMVVRGIYGEGTEALGNLYQISNQRSLGRSEEEFLKDLATVATHVIGEERKIRNIVIEKNRAFLEDKVHRSLGTLKEARLIGTNEALALLSDVRLGIDLGLISDAIKPTVQALMQIIRPAHLQKYLGNNLDPEMRDYYRATVIREELAKE
ncbi:MAG: protein arginine kinase [Firmicutes bacterium]|nr:protein arginine kinase [Bacillota bacterium]MDD4263893.1 protein arginine kinase [Bacillota bacterium]MDD4693082.1 protein arginine kinase [Bacillota bacterium]